jgi:hypothetical protein
MRTDGKKCKTDKDTLCLFVQVAQLRLYVLYKSSDTTVINDQTMGLLLPLFFVLLLGLTCSAESGNRVNCHPEPDVTKEECDKRQCKWDDSTYAVTFQP